MAISALSRSLSIIASNAVVSSSTQRRAFGGYGVLWREIGGIWRAGRDETGHRYLIVCAIDF
jgi:hypothetical protein